MQRQALLTTLVLANAFKEGDLVVGGSRDAQVRSAAQQALAALRVQDIMDTPCVDDSISDALRRSLQRGLAQDLGPLTIAEVRRMLLSSGGVQWAPRYRDGLASEAIAAVVKVMTNEELGRVARTLCNPLPGEGVAIGVPQHFGSRIQPNSPGDDEDEILLTILEGLTYGCGDVILGVNPASDDVDTIVRLEDLLCSVIEGLQLPTTSFREHPRLRHNTGRQISTAMHQRLNELGILDSLGYATVAATQTADLYALYRQARGETHPLDTLRAEGQRQLDSLRQRGYDLGYGCGPGYDPLPAVATRLATLYAHARQVLYAPLEEGVLRAVAPPIRPATFLEHDVLPWRPVNKPRCGPGYLMPPSQNGWLKRVSGMTVPSYCMAEIRRRPPEPPCC